MEEFEVKSDVFSGPIDVLLSLVEKRKLFINEISLAQIADDYVCFVNSLDQTKPSEIADFLYVASTLLLIKSRSLLPDFSITTEEEGNIEDLQKRLKILQEIRNLSSYISKSSEAKTIFQKNFTRDFNPVFSPSDDLILDNIFLATKNILERIPEKELTPKIKIRKVVTLQEMINNLEERIKKSAKLSFNDFSGKGKKEKVEVVVSFLAMLELIKNGSICATQDEHFGEINIENNEISTPKY